MTATTRAYKDTPFRRLFGDEREKANALSLYNALAGTSHEDPDALELTTVGGALYMGFKNVNINEGRNGRILEACETLAGYSHFVALVRRHAAGGWAETTPSTAL